MKTLAQSCSRQRTTPLAGTDYPQITQRQLYDNKSSGSTETFSEQLRQETLHHASISQHGCSMFSLKSTEEQNHSY